MIDKLKVLMNMLLPYGLWKMQKKSKNIFTVVFMRPDLPQTQKPERIIKFCYHWRGFTGVEMTGELLEWTSSLCRQYDIPEEEVRLFLVEGLDRILPNFKERLADKASSYLKKEGFN